MSDGKQGIGPLALQDAEGWQGGSCLVEFGLYVPAMHLGVAYLTAWEIGSNRSGCPVYMANVSSHALLVCLHTEERYLFAA